MDYLRDIVELKRIEQQLDDIARRYHVDGKPVWGNKFEELAMDVGFTVRDLELKLGIKIDDDLLF